MIVYHSDNYDIARHAYSILVCLFVNTANIVLAKY